MKKAIYKDSTDKNHDVIIAKSHNTTDCEDWDFIAYTDSFVGLGSNRSQAIDELIEKIEA